MRIEYVVISIILFLVVLLSILSFGKDIVPTFSAFVNNMFGLARNV